MDLIFKVNKRTNGSDFRRKAIPQMCATVASYYANYNSIIQNGEHRPRF